MVKFVKDTQQIAPITTVCNDDKVKLEAKIFRTKEEKAETKEVRTLAYVIRQNMGFAGQDNDVIDISFQNQSLQQLRKNQRGDRQKHSQVLN